jgi:phage baseplate assembly protein V
MSGFRVGLVTQQDVQNCRVRVVFPDHDQMVSWWLPVVVPKTHNDKAYWLPDLGEQVVCLMDAHDEDGAVLGAIYSQGQQGDATPPQMTGNKWHVTFQDGATVEYDRNLHTLAISVPANGTINITVNGGNLNLAAPNGDITFKTNQHQDSVNGIINTYNSHTHTDPQGGTTGTPTPTMS